jgi:hypothetical protein
MEWRQTTTKPPTTPTDLGTATDRLAVAALLAALLASLTVSEGVNATVGESSMQNPLARATMAIAAAETGGRSSVRALVLGGQGRAALVRYPCRRARKKYITISRIQRRERRNVRPCMPPRPPTTTKMPTRGHDHHRWRRNLRRRQRTTDRCWGPGIHHTLEDANRYLWREV